MPDALRTPAWRLIGLTRSEPGVLAFENGHLAYWTEDGLLFNVPLPEVSDVVFPWYYFSGGAKLIAGGDAYRFSFVEPNDAQPVPGHLMDRQCAGVGGSTKAIGIAAGRRAGAMWKRLLLP